jgi:hypothetical protein
VLVESATLCQAERLIGSSEHCNDEDAQIPFDHSRPRYRLRSKRDGLHFGRASEVPTVLSADHGENARRALNEPRRSSDALLHGNSSLIEPTWSENFGLFRPNEFYKMLYVTHCCLADVLLLERK